MGDAIVMIVTIRQTYGTMRAAYQAGLNASISLLLFLAGELYLREGKYSDIDSDAY